MSRCLVLSMPLVWGGLVPMAMAQNFTGSLQVEIVGLRDRTGNAPVRTGPPQFGKAMVLVAGATPITLQVRYSLQ